LHNNICTRHTPRGLARSRQLRGELFCCVKNSGMASDKLQHLVQLRPLLAGDLMYRSQRRALISVVCEVCLQAIKG